MYSDQVYLDAEGVTKVLNVSKSKAYEIIRILNKELVDLGFHTVTGKVSKQYFYEKFYITESTTTEKK